MADTPELDISMGNKAGAAISMGDPLSEPEFETIDGKAKGIDTDDIPEEDADGTTPEDDLKGDEEEGDQDGGSEDGDEGEEGDEPAEIKDLGEFDPEKVADWDAQYVKDGSLDVHGALSQEFFANAEAGNEGLNEGTYAYLESKGISKATVKDIEAMAKTNREAAAKDAKAVKQEHDLALMTEAGGPDPLREALKWGKDGGYTKEQQERFNQVMAGDDLEAKKDAVAALMVRSGVKKDKPRIPARDGTKGQGKTNNQVQPFASRAEYRKAFEDSKNNPRKAREVAARLKVSKF